MIEQTEPCVLRHWYKVIYEINKLAKDSRLTGLASGYAARAAQEMGKISREGITKDAPNASAGNATFTPIQEATIRLDLARIAINAGTPVDRLIEVVTPLSEWILGKPHSQPSSIGGKV